MPKSPIHIEQYDIFPKKFRGRIKGILVNKQLPYFLLFMAFILKLKYEISPSLGKIQHHLLQKSNFIV